MTETALAHTIVGAATAVVYGNYPDENELKQIYGLLNCPAFAGANVRIMPDHHAGAGCVIGFTAPINPADPKVVPNVVGVDIGCGVAIIALPEGPTREEHFLAFDRHLRDNVPSGFSIREEPHRSTGQVYEYLFGDEWIDFGGRLEDLALKVDADARKVFRSIGTLGGGNHFIELEHAVSEPGWTINPNQIWLTVHSGSRNFGLKVANYHQRKAQQAHPFGALSWLDGDDAREYLADMHLCQRYARLNRALMLYVLSEMYIDRVHLRLKVVDSAIESVHNYIGEDDFVIRKGAVSAKAGQSVVIPWNMRDGVIIGIGCGNPEWNNSAPHGAGRAMGRGEAKRMLSMDDYKASMDGIWSSCVIKATLDEAPMAYKPRETVEAALAGVVQVETRLKPIYNFKASEESR